MPHEDLHFPEDSPKGESKEAERRIEELVRSFNVPPQSGEADLEWRAKLDILLSTANLREVYNAWNILLDKTFGENWREPLRQKLVYLIERTQENYDLIPARGSDPEEQKVKMKNLKLLFHGTGRGLGSYLRKGIIAPKTEKATRYGEQIPLGESSFGSHSRQAENWTAGSPILVVDCNKINRNRIHMRYQHPTYEGDILPEAVAGVITKGDPSFYAIIEICRNAIAQNKPELLIPVLGSRFESFIYMGTYSSSLEKKNEGYEQCWPELEQSDCDTLQIFADSYKKQKKQ